MLEMLAKQAKFAVISVAMLIASVSASGQTLSAGGTGQGQAPVQAKGQAPPPQQGGEAHGDSCGHH